MCCQIHRFTGQHHTPALDRFNEVFATLRHKAEPCLVRMEFQNASQRLLGHDRKVVGIIEEHPGNRVGHGSHPSYKLGETLADGRDAAIIRGRKAKGHRCLMRRIRNTLRLEMLCDPGIGQHRLANARGAANNNMRWIFDLGPQEFYCRFLA